MWESLLKNATLPVLGLLFDLLHKQVLGSMCEVGVRSHSGRGGSCVRRASGLQTAPRMKVDVIFHIYAA